MVYMDEDYAIRMSIINKMGSPDTWEEVFVL
jgi:hypothetical protein